MAPLVIQVYCTDMGWVDTKHKADTIADAFQLERNLLADDSAWVNPSAPRQTRIMLRVS